VKEIGVPFFVVILVTCELARGVLGDDSCGTNALAYLINYRRNYYNIGPLAVFEGVSTCKLCLCGKRSFRKVKNKACPFSKKNIF